MTDQSLDPFLQELFTGTQEQLTGDEFTSQVLNKTKKFQYKIVTVIVVIALMLVPVTWVLSVELQALSLLIVEFLSTPIVELEGKIAFLLSPVNHIAAPMVLMLKLVRVFWKKIAYRG